MAGEENDFDLEWDDAAPKLIVAEPEDLAPPTHEWDELEMTIPPVAATDPLIATFTDLDLTPAREQLGVADTEDDWTD